MKKSIDNSSILEFREKGYLSLPRLISQDSLDELRSAYDEVLAGKNDKSGADDRFLGGKTRQIVFAERSHPTFKENEALTIGREVASKLRGWKEPAFFYSQLLYKPPGHLHETPWHQDDAYGMMPFTPAGTPLGHKSLQFWLAIDDADEENGCMHFHPPLGDDTLLPHLVASGEPTDEGRLLGLVDPGASIDETKVVACPLPAGAMTVHDSGTLHYTPPNRSNRPRRAYIFNFADPDFARRVVGSE